MKAFALFLFLSATYASIPALHMHESKVQEQRARVAADFLHRHLDQDTDDFRVVSAFHSQDSVCLNYVDTSAVIAHALIVDRSDVISWNVDAEDQDWTLHCGIARRDLTEFVRPEDRF